MSVIITGMDMPKNCIECNHMYLQEAINCQLIFSGCANCGRHPNCPLRSVEGLIEKIKMYRDLPVKQVIDIIEEYCKGGE